MSSRVDDTSGRVDPGERVTPEVRERLRVYYTRYYRDTLGIPGWRDLVQVRVRDGAYEGERLARLEQALERPVRGLRLLNVGCGTGGFNQAAEAAGALTWGVDLDAEAVTIARRRISRGALARATAASLPFRSGSFDVVYCYSTLEHVAEPIQALREMVRVLRPKGWLYLHTPSRGSCFETHYKILWPPGLPPWLGGAYLALRGRPREFLGTVRLTTVTECTRVLVACGIRTIRVLDGDRDRPVGGRLWPLVRLYYRLARVRPFVELLAVR
jgi:SAM-dependent methyltransferase